MTLDESIDVLRQLQGWIKSVGTEYETPPPPQPQADAAIQNVLAEVARLSGLRELCEQELCVPTQEAKYRARRAEAKLDAALAIIDRLQPLIPTWEPSSQRLWYEVREALTGGRE